MREHRVFGVLVTFRRHAALATMLRRLAELDRPFDGLVVVDNSPSPDRKRLVDALAEPGHAVEYIAATTNLGPSGGRAKGMEHVLEVADDQDWIVCLDDDEAPSSRVLRELLRFGETMRARDPMVGGVGAVGGRFDPKRGVLIRVRDEELTGPIRVDTIGGGQLPFFRVKAIREAGTFSRDLFFGFEELELGLRLREHGYSLYAYGRLWRERRASAGRLGLDPRPSRTLGQVTWRRYYSLRNMIYILRLHGRFASALRVTLLHGLAKPLANVPVTPREAIRHLRSNGRAARDAWIGRMGRTVEPDSAYEAVPDDLDQEPVVVPGAEVGA